MLNEFGLDSVEHRLEPSGSFANDLIGIVDLESTQLAAFRVRLSQKPEQEHKIDGEKEATKTNER